MQLRPWLLVFLAGCPSGSLEVPDSTKDTVESDTDADSDSDSDADTDIDTDADTDADTDVDTDSDTDIDTTPTGDTGPAPPPPPDWSVDCNGAGDFLTIQEAIDAAVSGETIGVEPCEYHERIDFLGKAVDVFGTQGSAMTIIDGDAQGTVVNVEYGEPDGTRLAGFTITDGEDDDDGAAIQIEYASVELEDLVITGNDGLTMIWAVAGLVDMDGVVIDENIVLAEGQAIFSDGGGLTATRITVDCDGGAEAIYHHNTLILSDSDVQCRGGNYGIHGYHGEDRIQRSWIAGGIAGVYAYDVESTTEEPDTPDERFRMANCAVNGGAIGVDVRYMDVEIVNSVLTGGDSALSVLALLGGSSAIGTVFTGAACGITADATFAHTFSAFWDNVADGCGINVNPAVTADPLFVAWPTDLHLQAGSPLIDAGPVASDREDLDGSRNDIGVYGGPLPLP